MGGRRWKKSLGSWMVKTLGGKGLIFNWYACHFHWAKYIMKNISDSPKMWNLLEYAGIWKGNVVASLWGLETCKDSHKLSYYYLKNIPTKKIRLEFNQWQKSITIWNKVLVISLHICSKQSITTSLILYILRLEVQIIYFLYPHKV